MGLLMAFAVGCVVGARAGSEDFSDVVQSVHAIRESEEFRDLVTALRSHASQTLRSLADMVDKPGTDAISTQDLVERVTRLVGRD
jgi:hypothetical protein